MYIHTYHGECFSPIDSSWHTEYFTNYGIYFKQRLLLCLHFYNKLHNDHHQMSLINTIEHFSISSITFSLSMIRPFSIYRFIQLKLQAIVQPHPKTPPAILLLQAQAIEKQNRIRTQAKHEIKKRGRKKINDYRNWWKRLNRTTNKLKEICSYKRKEWGHRGEQTCCNPQYLHSNYS